ncbi:MAG: invasion associated locus B family protein [Bauldia sp.]|nr:invasion associated locus B family protein [Bauldia sp.]
MTRFIGLVRRMRRISAAGFAVFAFSTGAALAQNPFPGLTTPAPAAPPAAAPQAGAAPTADMPWQKICEDNPQTNQQICSLRADIRDDNGTVIVRVALQRAPDADRYGLLVFAPLGVLIQPGVVVAIDGSRTLSLAFEVCVPNPTICIAQADAPTTLIDQMKRGGQMTFTVASPQRPIPLPLSLRGFTRTFDGPGTVVPQGQPPATPVPAP